MRNRLKYSLPLFLFALLFPATVLAMAQRPPVPGGLVGKDLKQLFSDRTVEATRPDGKGRALLYFEPNGKVQKIDHGRMLAGQWKLRKNSRLCTDFGGKWKCRAVAKQGNEVVQYIVKKDGNHRPELIYRQFYPGNQLKKLYKAPLLPAGTLRNKQLKKLFSDHTVESVTVKKGRLSLTYYAPDGKVEQLRNGVKRSGFWRVKKNRICLQMEDRKEKCRIVVKEGQSYRKFIVKKNGNHQPSVVYRRFLPGKQL